MPQEDIRGLKDLIHIPYPFYDYLIGAALLAALVFLAAILVRRIFRKTKGPEPAAPPQPLHERILEELSNLRNRDDVGPGADKTFHFLLSEIFRRYLEGRFQFAATDSTTEEIAAHLPDLDSLTGPQRESILRILRETDAVKFAERRKSKEEALALIGLAEAFVRETAPQGASGGTA
ncbi:MAG TPA: hypothetical protein VLJ37_08775 [bacterium]|nr:hypothetical protein [bacterium]